MLRNESVVEMTLTNATQLSSNSIQKLIAESTQDRRGDTEENPHRPAQLLIVAKLREPVREQLADARLSWIERDTGVLHIDVSPYYIHTAEPTRPGVAKRRAGDERSTAKRPSRLVGRSGRCAESLLLWHDANGDNHDSTITSVVLAQLADVDQALASRVLHRLEQAEALTPNRRGRRTLGWAISRPDRILDLWADEDTKSPKRTLAYVWAPSPRALLEEFRKLSDVALYWALGGVSAANLYAPTLTAEPIPTLWIPDSVPASAALKALSGEAVTEGHNLVLQQTPNDPWALNRMEPTRQYEDAPRDPRTRVIEVLGPAIYSWNPSRPLPTVPLVSKPRAYVEAVHEKRGRAAEVAEALRKALPFEQMAH
jgi:hypothetical protein